MAEGSGRRSVYTQAHIDMDVTAETIREAWDRREAISLPT